MAERGGICPVCKKWYRPNGVGPSDLPELTRVLDNLPSSGLLRYGANWHDWSYHIGVNWGSRMEADILMFEKNEEIIDKKGTWWNRWFYRWANERNYRAVRDFGAKFWNENGCK
jgi:hypothetical protein